ncbi:MAG: hypothetical protein GIW99_04495 [Candidatus Eremiobacteraeota bacterium]|nr:hypothetical protein [Candidatus Eremiobacteraeota bacterium]MBC5826930.1 hypothetical protein [Candidatus Eremiobacteraeota bacterium]
MSDAIRAAVFGLCTSAAVALAAVLSPALASAEPVSAVPQHLSDLRGFRGRVSYVGRRFAPHGTDVATGTLVAADRCWALDESHDRLSLHAGPDGGTLRSREVSAGFDDALQTDELVNPWAVILGKLTCESWERTALAGAWRSADGMRVYLDADRTHVVGASEPSGPADLSFTFGDWLEQDGLQLPRRIVRLRNGFADATYEISKYVVTRAIAAPSRDVVMPAVVGSPLPDASATSPDLQAGVGRRLWATLIVLAAVGFGAIAWLRRELLVERLCRRLSADPRGWRSQGESAFVSPEGLLYLDGRSYDVGSSFYNRVVTVQHSPLFLRVSSAAVPSAVVLPRKFRSEPHRKSRNTAAFSLIDIVVATGLFAVVIVGAVFPALIAVARAGSLAQKYAAAASLARNALSDQEAVCAYEPGVQTGSSTKLVGGLALTVDITAATAGADDISVAVRDSDGRTLIRAVTMVGPPVPRPSTAAPPIGNQP